MSENFFKQNDIFCTERTAMNNWRRLNRRHFGIIEHVDFKDKTVLDLGSHDGRWSIAAVKAGAKHVVGLEGRREAVTQAKKNAVALGVSDKTSFAVSDIDSNSIENHKVDIVLCCGIFYHIANHYTLFRQMYNTGAKTIVIDGQFLKTREAAVWFKPEPVDQIDTGLKNLPNTITLDYKKGQSLVGVPSMPFVGLLAHGFGFTVDEVNYNNGNVSNNVTMADYILKDRRTLILKKKQ